MSEKFHKELEPHHLLVLNMCEDDSPEQLGILAEELLTEAGRKRAKREGREKVEKN